MFSNAACLPPASRQSPFIFKKRCDLGGLRVSSLPGRGNSSQGVPFNLNRTIIHLNDIILTIKKTTLGPWSFVWLVSTYGNIVLDIYFYIFEGMSVWKCDLEAYQFPLPSPNAHDRDRQPLAWLHQLHIRTNLPLFLLPSLPPPPSLLNRPKYMAQCRYPTTTTPVIGNTSLTEGGRGFSNN